MPTLPLASVLLLGFLQISASQAAVAPARIEVEKNSPAIKDGRLVEDIGLETLGGVFTPLARRGHEIPVRASEIFACGGDGQREIWIRLARGTHDVFARNHELGWFAVGSLPAAPRGILQVNVTVVVQGSSIALEAMETGGARLTLTRGKGPKKPR